MENSKPIIFVIVVTYKGKQWYDRCFTSLRKSTIPVQTIVVDNASNDDTVEYIRENYPEIILIESKENLGFGKGNNLALKYAYEHGCDYVFLLNQDAWIDTDDVVEKLVEVAHRHPEYGILSPMHLSVDKSGLVMKEFCRQPCNEKLITDLYLNKLSDIYETTYIHAAAWLIPFQTLQTVGGFDPIYFHYGEDDDYLHRVRYHKKKIGVCPFVKIIHDHHDHQKTSEQLQYFHNLNQLVEYMDINRPFKVREYMKRYRNKWLRCVRQSGFKQSRYILKDILFLREKSNEIQCHRKHNMQVGSSWL